MDLTVVDTIAWYNLCNNYEEVDVMAEKDINKLIEDAQRLDPSALMAGIENEKDPTKKAIYVAAYDYVIGQRQKKVIDQKEFVR